MAFDIINRSYLTTLGMTLLALEQRLYGFGETTDTLEHRV